MMMEWNEYIFSDFVDINPKVTLKANQQYSFVEMKDLEPNNKFCLPSQNRVLAGGARFNNGDTLFARITPCLENGKICQVKGLENNLGFGSTEFLVFRGKKDVSDSDFVYYLSRWDEVRSYAEINLHGTSGRQRVPREVFDKYTLFLPLLPEQEAIAEVLSSLDDKIDLLHRNNKTLEQLAETLFRQWFVEEADDSWEEVSLGSIVETELGGTPSTTNPEYWNGSIPWINSGEVNNYRIFKPTKYITELGLRKSNTKLLPKKSTVIAITGATMGQVSYLEIDSCANQSVVGVIPNEIYYPEYIHLLVRHHVYDMLQNETGGAQPHINKNDVKSVLIKKPNNEKLCNHRKSLELIYDKISINCFSIDFLQKLRDTLLPKLMSGEVRVQDIKTTIPA